MVTLKNFNLDDETSEKKKNTDEQTLADLFGEEEATETAVTSNINEDVPEDEDEDEDSDWSGEDAEEDEDDEDDHEDHEDEDDDDVPAAVSEESAMKRSDDMFLESFLFGNVHKKVIEDEPKALDDFLQSTLVHAPLGSKGSMAWEKRDGLGRLPIHLCLLEGCKWETLQVLVKYDFMHLQAQIKQAEDDALLEELSKPLGTGDEFQKDDEIETNRELKKDKILCRSTILSRLNNQIPCLILSFCHAPWHSENCEELIKVLCSFQDIKHLVCAQLDEFGRNALHVACQSGKLNLVRVLAEAFPFMKTQCDSQGNWPLHYAIDWGCSSIVSWFINDFGPLEFFEHFQNDDKNPIVYAVTKCSWESLSVVIAASQSLGLPIPQAAADKAEELGVVAEMQYVLNDLGFDKADGGFDEALFNSRKPNCQSAILYDPDCFHHLRLPSLGSNAHRRVKQMRIIMENPTRLEVLIGPSGSLNHEYFASTKKCESAKPCVLADVLRVHDWNYVREIQQNMLLNAPVNVEKDLQFDRDTHVSRESWNATLKAAGCVVQAVDLVAGGECRNAFACVRPPGHHVGSRGPLSETLEDDEPGEGSLGFCFLNNACIGASYALNVYRHIISRVAIIDFDIHHGNGTEAIVRGLCGPKDVYFNMNRLGLSGTLKTSVFVPWLDPSTDKDNVFFASTHVYGAGFYPSSGASLIDKNIVNVGFKRESATSAEFRKAYSDTIIPKLIEFCPDIIFISAGFDGHYNDRSTSARLQVEDYYWVTEQLMGIAAMKSSGRIVSVLEGGYNTIGGWLSPMGQSVAAHMRALSTSDVRRPPSLLVANINVTDTNRVMMEISQDYPIDEDELVEIEEETEHHHNMEIGDLKRIKKSLDQHEDDVYEGKSNKGDNGLANN